MFLLFLSNIWSFIIDFSKTTFGKVVIGIIILCLMLFFSYYKGYNSGVDYVNTTNQKILEKALEEQRKKLTLEKEKALEVAQAQIKIETVYKDRVIKVDKIINNNPQIKECKINQKDFEDFNKALDDIK